MKKLLLILLCLPVIGFAQITMGQLEKKGDLFFKIGENQPYTGKVQETFKNKSIKLQGECKYGEKNGKWKEFKLVKYIVKRKRRGEVERDIDEANHLTKIRNSIVGYTFTHNVGGLKLTIKLNKDNTHISQAIAKGKLLYTLEGSWWVRENGQGIIISDNYSSLGMIGDERWYDLDNRTLILDDDTPMEYKRSGRGSESWNESFESFKYKWGTEFYSETEEKTILILDEQWKENQLQNQKKYIDKDKLILEKKWNTDGLLIYEFLIIEDSLEIKKWWYDNGKLKMIHDSKGSKTYFEDGSIQNIQTENNYSEYNEKGDLVIFGEGSFSNKKGVWYKNGTCIVYKKDGRVLRNDKYKLWNEEGDEICDLTTDKKGQMISGYVKFYSKANKLMSDITFEKTDNINIIKKKFVIYFSNGKIKKERIYYTINLTKTDDRRKEISLLIKYNDFFENGNPKKSLLFRDSYLGKVQLRKMAQGNVTIFNYKTLMWEGYDIIYDLFKDFKYNLFFGNQYVWHVNGEIKYEVTFNKKCYDYSLKLEKSTYLSKGLEYDEKGKKVGKIYWDHYGRICDKKGNVLVDEILNEY